MGSQTAEFDTLRVLAFGSILGTYVAVGSATTRSGRMVKIANYTNAPLIISYDGTTDQDFIAEQGFTLYDFTTNKSQSSSNDFQLDNLTTFYVRHIGVAPTSGSVYVTFICNSRS